MKMKLNVGCGRLPVRDWTNIDNSPTLKLAKVPYLPEALFRMGLIKGPTVEFASLVRAGKVEYGDVARGLAYPDASCDAIYSSHMLEHLDRNVAGSFLSEAFRLLRPGGVIRISVPDLKKLVRAYESTDDADAFMKKMYVCIESPRSLLERAKLAIIGFRHHQWMYDGASLSRMLESQGFEDVAVLPPGKTNIANPGALNLYERESSSVYVEGIKPMGLARRFEASSRTPEQKKPSNTQVAADHANDM